MPTMQLPAHNAGGLQAVPNLRMEQVLMGAMIRRLIDKALGILPDWLLRIFPPEKLIKFCVVGGIGALIGLGLLYVFVERAGLHYLVALGIAWAIVSYIVYMGNCGWTFKSFLGIRGFGKFVASRMVTTVMGFGLVALLTSGLGVWYMASPVIGTSAMALVNFLISKRWIWQKNSDSANSAEKGQFPKEKEHFPQKRGKNT